MLRRVSCAGTSRARADVVWRVHGRGQAVAEQLGKAKVDELDARHRGTVDTEEVFGLPAQSWTRRRCWSGTHLEVAVGNAKVVQVLDSQDDLLEDLARICIAFTVQMRMRPAHRAR